MIPKANTQTVALFIVFLVVSMVTPALSQCGISSEEFFETIKDLSDELISEPRDAGLPSCFGRTDVCFGEYRGQLQGGRSDSVRGDIQLDSRGFIRVSLSIGGEEVPVSFFSASDFKATFPEAGVCLQARFFRGPCTLIGMWVSLANPGQAGLWFVECFECCPEFFEEEEEEPGCPTVQWDDVKADLTEPTAEAATPETLFVLGENWLGGRPPSETERASFSQPVPAP